MTSVRVLQNTFTDRHVNESNVRATIVNHTQRGSRGRGASLFGGKGASSPCSCLPLHPRESLSWITLVLTLVLIVFVVVFVFVAVVVSPIDLPRQVDLRICSNALTVCVHPGSVYMAPVVLVYQRGTLMVVGRYMLKQRELKD